MTASVTDIAQRFNLQAALYYAELGFFVFPLHSIINGQCTCKAASRCHAPGKHPRTNHGWKDATLDPETIKRWFHQWPNSGVGIATGLSGLVVIDIDPRNRGDVSLQDLPEFPHTPRVLTGGGGFHYFFRKPPGEFKGGCSLKVSILRRMAGTSSPYHRSISLAVRTDGTRMRRLPTFRLPTYPNGSRWTLSSRAALVPVV